MIRSIYVAVMAAVVLAGCAAQPSYPPTARADQNTSASNRNLYTDSRGQYRPDWAAGINRPSNLTPRHSG